MNGIQAMVDQMMSAVYRPIHPGLTAVSDFDPYERAAAVRRVLAGERQVDVARSIGADPSVLYKWVTTAKKGEQC